MNILLLGPHGAGKSTQAHLLSAALKLPYLSTGEMLRVLASQPTEVGKHIRYRLEHGEYMTDEEMIPLVEERIRQIDATHGFILEGFPRTLPQAKQLNITIDIVLNLSLSIDESMKRLLARQRMDDTPEIIRRRLEHYQADADAIIDHYRHESTLIEVDANQSVEKVQQDIMDAIQKVDSHDRN